MGKGEESGAERACSAVLRGEKGRGAGGGAVPSEERKQCCRLCCAEWVKVKEAVLCGAGGVVLSGKVKEAVLFGAGGDVARWEGKGSGAA